MAHYNAAFASILGLDGGYHKVVNPEAMHDLAYALICQYMAWDENHTLYYKNPEAVKACTEKVLSTKTGVDGHWYWANFVDNVWDDMICEFAAWWNHLSSDDRKRLFPEEDSADPGKDPARQFASLVEIVQSELDINDGWKSYVDFDEDDDFYTHAKEAADSMDDENKELLLKYLSFIKDKQKESDNGVFHHYYTPFIQAEFIRIAPDEFRERHPMGKLVRDPLFESFMHDLILSMALKEIDHTVCGFVTEIYQNRNREYYKGGKPVLYS